MFGLYREPVIKCISIALSIWT